MFILTELTPIQITFIIAVPIVVILVLIAIFYKPIMKLVYKKRYKDMYGKKIYKLALYEDYYLINGFVFKYEDNKYTRIDHILFGEKFIYLINDYYFKNGSLTGNAENQSLVLVQNDKKIYVDNPLNDSKLLLNRLSYVTNIDKDMLISISLINDECNIEIEQNSQQFYLIQKKYFTKLIKAIESRPIANINEIELQRVVKDLDKYNRKGKMRRDKKNS